MENATCNHLPSKTTAELFAGWRWALAGLAVLVFAFYARFLLTGSFFLMRDLIFDFFPRHQFYKTHLLQGVLPLWNPYTGGGEPFFSNLECAVFYPPNLLYLLFPVPTANVILVSLHVLLAGFGVWLACRAWRISQQGSLLAAVAFAFGTQMATRIEFYSFLCSLAWYPLAVALFTLWLRQPTRRIFLSLALVMSLQLFGGYPEVVVFTAATLLIYALVAGSPAKLSPQGRLKRTSLAVLAVAGMGALALLLSLAQVLPVLNIIPLSARAAQNPMVEYGSVNPAMWFTAIFPYLYGKPGYFGRYWAPACQEFWMGTFYVGLLPVMLGLTVLIRRGMGWRRQPGEFSCAPVAGLRTTFLLVILVFFMLYAMGGFTPLFGLLWKVIPPLRWFRWPAKALMVVSFALCCLGGIALDWLANQNGAKAPVRSGWRQRLADYGPLTLWLLLAAVAVACLLIGDNPGEWLLRRFFNLAQVEEKYSHRIPWEVLANDFLKFLVVGGLAAVLIQVYISRPERRRLAFGGMVLVLFADLLVTTYPLLRASKMDIMHNSSDYKKLFRSGKLEGRVYRFSSQQLNYGVKNEKLVRLARDTMGGYWPIVDKVQFIRPGGDFKLFNYMQLFSAYEYGQVPEPFKTGILRNLGATYVLESALHPGYFEGEDYITPELFRIDGSLPDAMVVGRAEGFPSRDALLSALVYGNRDLMQVALLADRDLAKLAPLGGKGPVEHEIVNYRNRPNGLTVEVKSAEAGLLVVNATDYPSWEATVNGQPAEIHEANGAFRAVEIPAGNSLVEMDYRPSKMLLGLYLSLASLALVLALFFWPGKLTLAWLRRGLGIARANP